MTSDLQKAADATARELEILRTSNASLTDEVLSLRNELQALDTNYIRLQEAAGRALNERDYYMRECAELTAKFTTFTAMAREALETHRMAPFRPNGAAPADEPAKISDTETFKAIAEANGMDDAIPAFLTKPLQVYGGGGSGGTDHTKSAIGDPHKAIGPLKLRRKI